MKTTDKFALRTAIQQIKDSVDGSGLLQALGFEIKKETSDEIRCRCIIHGGDNDTAFRFKKSTKNFSCYTHGCHEESSDIVGLVCAVRKCTFKEAIEFLSEFTGIPLDRSFTEEEAQRFYTLKDLKKAQRDVDFDKRLQEAGNPDEVEWLASHVEYCTKNRTRYFEERGFLKNTLDFFEVGSTKYFSEGTRATIPIRDESSQLVGISTRIERDLLTNESIPKYRNLKNFNKESHLYNLYNAKQYAPMFGDTLILVEGYTGVWRLWEAGIPIAVSCMGVSLSPIQRHYISKHCLSCIIMLDGDNAGLRGSEKIQKSLSGFVRTQTYWKEGEEPSKYNLNELHDLAMGLLES